MKLKLRWYMESVVAGVEYESEAVEAGYEIDDWSGQTLKRSDDVNY